MYTVVPRNGATLNFDGRVAVKLCIENYPLVRININKVKIHQTGVERESPWSFDVQTH